MKKSPDSHGSPSIGYMYDIITSVLWLPSKNKLYDKCIDVFDVKRGTEVLELGCGTGTVTKRLTALGARVTAVDQLEAMLQRAKKKAPEANFILGNILEFSDRKKYDLIVISFVLHALDKGSRTLLLKSCRKLITENGKVAITDYHLPQKWPLRKLWPEIISIWEPPTVLEILNGDFKKEFAASGMSEYKKVDLHGGRAQLLLLKKSGHQSLP